MAPVSILPGRIRLETPFLAGRPEECGRLERRLTALDGVREVSANFRTGRILVRFDEETVQREELLRQFAQLLSGLEQEDAVGTARPGTAADKGPARGGLSSKVARHLLWDAVAHSLLPGPFALLVPTAVAAFRR